MKSLTIVTVIGARPQFVKAAVVSRVLRGRPGVREVLLHTGQHYDEGMSEVFFRELSIPQPDVNLGIGSGLHGAQTGRMLEAIEQVLLKEAPGCVLVYGDTNSTLAGALAAVKLHIPVAHVEAGLRSFNRAMPEEINRVVADHVSTMLFAPTETAVVNLRGEGIAASAVHRVGDVMYDAALFHGREAAKTSNIVRALGLEGRPYVLATIHRSENTDEPRRLEALFTGLERVAEHIPVVMPVHPRTRKAWGRSGDPCTSGLMLIDPVGYLDMVMLEKNARLIATDSGGVQKEAFFHHVPCVTLRTETEWVELVQSGWNRLVPPEDGEQVAENLLAALDAPLPDVHPSFYGDGDAATRIADHLTGLLGSRTRGYC